MVVCCICKIGDGTLKITDGNPKYKGKPICKECGDIYRNFCTFKCLYAAMQEMKGV